MKKASVGIKQAASGKVKVQVVDSKTGKVKRDYGWQKNLILNQGLNGIGSARTWAAATTHCAAGTGTTPTQDNSGATTATQSGTTVTLSGGSFTFTDTGTDTGKMIKWDSGEEAMIVSITNSTTAEVNVSQAVSADAFNVFRTNQTGLTTEVKRTNTYLTGVDNCGSTYVENEGKATFRRTYDFTVETGSVTYTEIGFSHVATVAANLFSRILLSTPVALIADDVLRVVYDLTIQFSFFEPRTITPTISGWTGVTGQEMLECFGIAEVSTTGAVTTTNRAGDPVTANRIGYSNSTDALQANPAAAPFNSRTGTERFSKTVVLSTYVNDTFTRTKTMTALPAEGNMSGIRSIFYGLYATATTFYPQIAFLMADPQEKLNTHTLTLSYVYTWGRVLA
jgi:hypothetical protein